MAKLITDHDPFHIHKILGVFALTNFLYRFLYATLVRGYVFCSVQHAADGLCESQQTHIDAACIALHAVLSWSSLLLPLPKKRNFSSPMIWVEFRFHSITFATRGVVASLLSLYGLWPDHILLNYAAKLTLLLTTCYTADFITAKYGCTEKRTTNAMPYPDCITPELQANIKYNYSSKQFAAGLACISGDATLPWATLLAIQGAPLLMTLVRKGKITALTFHRTYILQLATPLYIFMMGHFIHWNRYDSSNAIQTTQCRIWIVAMLHFLTTRLRIECEQSKFVTWAISAALIVFATEDPRGWAFLTWLHTNPRAHAFVLFGHLGLGHMVMRHYVPVFTLTDRTPEQLDYIIFDFIRKLVTGKWIVRVRKVVWDDSDDVRKTPVMATSETVKKES